MGLRELDIDLTDDQKAMRDSAKKFFAEVWRPAAIQLDKLPYPQDVIAERSVLWDVFRKSYQMGFHKMIIPKAFGGLEVDALTGALVYEQMGWAASDLAASVSVSSFPFSFSMISNDLEVQNMTRRFCEDTDAKMIGCWALTEPDHGSDWILPHGEHSSNPKCTPSVKAKRDGDEYVINRQKSAWISNGTIATHAALFLSLDPSKGMENCGIAAIPLNYPGISRGKPLDKMGQRALNQGEILFDNVRIPKTNIVCKDPPTFKVIADITLATANAGMENIFSGLGQAALEEALKYAKERVQGGKTIMNHQNVKLKLFDMFMSVEAARCLARRLSVYNSVTRPPALHYSIASKVFSTETAFRVASHAIQIFGGYGLSREYPIEKIFRDARAAMIEDGVNETLAIGGAERL